MNDTLGKACQEHLLGRAVLTPSDRDDALCWASYRTIGVADPEAVVANAAPILAWLGEASSKEDLQARMWACRQQSRNDMDGNRARDNDTTAFVERAAVLYAAMIGVEK
ncbi:hypothetical protein AB0395_21975 [Streptosporangium sp. NPDC051023]|uniref:hypothetical protein n=1 Tax=Streptosporangium sp. NPDC051023 TaxID=3155410 RepID=UPI00344FDE3B